MWNSILEQPSQGRVNVPSAKHGTPEFMEAFAWEVQPVRRVLSIIDILRLSSP